MSTIDSISSTINLLDRAEKRNLCLVAILGVVAAVFESLSVISVGTLMTSIFSSVKPEVFYFLGDRGIVEVHLLLALTVLITVFLKLYYLYLVSMFTERTEAQIGARILNQLLALPVNSARQGNSKMINLITAEVRTALQTTVVPMIQLFIGVIGLVSIALGLYNYIGAQVFYLAGILGSIYFIFYYMIRSFFHRWGTERLHWNELRHSILYNIMLTLREIKFYQNESLVEKKFTDVSLSNSRVQGLANFAKTAPSHFFQGIFIFLGLLGLVMADRLGVVGPATVALIATLAYGGARAIPTVQAIYSSIVLFAYGRAAVSRITEVKASLLSRSAQPIGLVSKLSGEQRPENIRSLSLRNVSFSYDHGMEILSDISLNVMRGEHCLVHGPSGRGKSTLMGIMVGLIDPACGGVFISYNDGAEVEISSPINSIAAYIPQNTILFEGTLEDYCRAAGAQWTSVRQIQTLLDGVGLAEQLKVSESNFLSYKIEDFGANLSGGQRQRLSIFRALLQPKPFIFFDESFSSLDAESEISILKFIRESFPDVTVVQVSHRPEISKIFNCSLVSL